MQADSEKMDWAKAAIGGASSLPVLAAVGSAIRILDFGADDLRLLLGLYDAKADELKKAVEYEQD